MTDARAAGSRLAPALIDWGAVYVVLPGDVDDPANPSGGNVYDRRLCQGLAAAGRQVYEIAVGGSWPRPDAASRAELAAQLAIVPDGAVVLLDGLVACGVPEIVVPHAGRLHLAVLVHMPLSDEIGLSSAETQALDVRERRVLGAAAAVIATSSWSADRLAAHHGLPGAKVHTVSPGTDPAPLAGGDAKQLLCVAAVTPTKGQDLLVEALAAVRDLPWTCVCAGPLHRDPGYVVRLRQSIERHGLGDRVRLAGPRTGEALARTYAGSGLVVLPSRAETYGMVVSEALARGIPVLAAAVGGVPGTLGRTPDGDVPGILVPPGDIAAISAAIRDWCADPGLRRRLREAALRRRAELTAWPRTAQQMAAVLDRSRGARP